MWNKTNDNLSDINNIIKYIKDNNHIRIEELRTQYFNGYNYGVVFSGNQQLGRMFNAKDIQAISNISWIYYREVQALKGKHLEELDNVKRQYKLLKDDYKNLEAEYDEVFDEVEELKEEQDVLQERIEELEEENGELQEQNEELEYEQDELKDENDKLKDDVEEALDEIDDYIRLNDKLRNQKEALIKFLKTHQDTNRPTRTLYYQFLEEQFEKNN